MKCDGLKPLVFSIVDLAYIDEIRATRNFQNPHDHAVYKATEVDEAIAELKAKLESVQASMYADVVDANMKNVKLKDKLDSMAQQFSKYVVDAHNRERKLKRALYKALANWAFLAQLERGESVENCVKWEKVERKCRAKAEEYK
ncbi:MAG: hypothetical protein IKJ45_05780 [Kiritimatiellae bacterium]|nr:hypothetical protein [Kiritimatiellia bacterium]